MNRILCTISIFCFTALAPAQTNLHAWHTNGQTWLVWSDTQPQPAPQTYDLYVRGALSTNLALWTPIGRVLQQDWQARRLRTYTPATQWQIPTAGGPYHRLAPNEALFVYTPHAAATQYFTVVRHGQVALSTNNVVGPVAQPLTQSVTCHPQLSGTNANTGQSYSDFAFWLDGRADWTNSRPDIPVLGNASFNGVASLFRVYQPTVSQPPGAKLPMVLFAHPMNRNWAEWVPGAQTTANLSFVLTNGLLVTLDDGTWVFDKDLNQVEQAFTFWFGYWEGFDRLAASETNYPPQGALVVDFTVRRTQWLLDWLVANQLADSNRIAWIGSSMGAGGGGMNVRAHPERFSAAMFFVAMIHDPSLVAYTGAQFGTPIQNLPTPLGLGMEDLFFPTNSPAPHKLPPMRFVWGVNDTNVDWDSASLGQKTNVIPTLAASRLGFITYWDERGHEPPSWAGHWAGPNTNASDGSTLLTAQFLTRYRNDQSFPAFSNDSHPDTNVFLAVPFCATCTNWGTRNGYFDWDVATIADTATNWAVTLWMHSTNTTSFSNDVPAFATARTDVTIRRPQQFKPAPGATVVWTYTSNNVVIANGATSADSDGFVTVTNLTLYKDPARPRLEITFPPANRIHVVTVNPNGSFSPARVEIFDGDTVEWRFTNRGGTIIPVNFNGAGSLCTNYLPYNPADPNEFTGPMPRAVSGIFALSPEETPYAMQNVTWQNTNVTGVFIRLRWDDVHLGTNQFDWDELDAEIAKAVANGKVYSLGFKAGVRGTPQWIFNPNRTTAPVTPLDFGFRSAGQTNFYGSPADPNYRKHFNDLLRATAAHLRERNAFYRALAYIKISGLNLFTHENRLPNETNDLPIWASLGQYTPAALDQFYGEQTALLAAEFPDKEMSYALIQDGFPLINDDGEFAGQSAPTNSPLPIGAAQTERILNVSRTSLGTRFVVQHNGLQPKPTNCPGEGVHPIVLDPNFHYVGSGCPNRWVLEQASLGQITGYQIVSGITNLTDLESTFSNAWDNSDGIFVEIYQANALSAAANGLPSGKTLGEWAEQFHQRRRTAWLGIPDPFPLRHRHAFTRTVPFNSGPQLLNFINGSNCSTNYGVVVILPDLSFTALVRNPDGSVQLTLAVARAGTLRIDYSDDLVRWALLESRRTPAGVVEVTDVSATAFSKFYRAALIGP